MFRAAFTSVCTGAAPSRAFCSSVNRLAPRPRPKNWHLDGIPPPQPITIEPSIDLSEDIPSDPPKIIHGRKPAKRPTPFDVREYKSALKARFPDGWAPPRKLSREAMEGLRELHRHDPETFTTPVLAAKFRVSPEAVRRILKSKWEPSREQRVRLAERERVYRTSQIKVARLKEMKKQVMITLDMERELEMLNRMSEERAGALGKSRRKSETGEHDGPRQPKGRDSKDKLFFS